MEPTKYICRVCDKVINLNDDIEVEKMLRFNRSQGSETFTICSGECVRTNTFSNIPFYCVICKKRCMVVDFFAYSILCHPNSLRKIHILESTCSEQCKQSVFHTQSKANKFETDAIKTKCISCFKQHDTTIPKCGGCEKVRYCNQECQKAHWIEHKPICEMFKKMKLRTDVV